MSPTRATVRLRWLIAARAAAVASSLPGVMFGCALTWRKAMLCYAFIFLLLKDIVRMGTLEEAFDGKLDPERKEMFF